MRWGGSVDKMTRLQAAGSRNLSSIPGSVKKCKHFPRFNKKPSSFLGIKRSWCKANHLPHLVLQLRISGAKPPLPLYLHDVDRNTSMLNDRGSNSRRECRNFLFTTGSRSALFTTQSSTSFRSFFIRGKGDWILRLYLNYLCVSVWAISLRPSRSSHTLMQEAAVFLKLYHQKDTYVT
jgi:hypothetical protein